MKIGSGEEKNELRQKRKEIAIWQRRFWEHTIRDEQDLNAHPEYIHYNPVKHGYVKKPAEWKWSSFLRYASQGMYEMDWGECVSKIPEAAGME